LKPLSLNNLRGSLAMAGGIAALLWIAPVGDGGPAALRESANAVVVSLAEGVGDRLGALLGGLRGHLPAVSAPD
jgi:hypothetical protein